MLRVRQGRLNFEPGNVSIEQSEPSDEVELPERDIRRTGTSSQLSSLRVRVSSLVHLKAFL